VRILGKLRRPGLDGALLDGALLGGVLLGGTLLGLAGCGGSATHMASGASGPAGRSVGQLVAQRKAAVRDADSTHLAGQVTGSGQATALDLSVLRAGGLAGSITQHGVPLELIGAGGKVYIKATPAFLHELRAPAAVCAVMCGKYVQMSGTAGRQLDGSLNMTSLTRAFITGLPRMTRAGTATVAGQQAVVLHGADGSILDVAAHGTPYPLRVISPPRHHETLTFSQWDRVGTPAAPPASKVINLSQLKAGSS
jgi:hypothetical protein